MHRSRRYSLAAGLLAACLAAPAMAQTATPPPAGPSLRICAGTERGNYTFTANEIAKRIGREQFPGGVTVIRTGGSLDNLRRLETAECDVAIAQSDVTAMYQTERANTLNGIVPFAKLYVESTHILCPVASGWESVSDMGKAAAAGRRARLIVGPDGGGSAETWRGLRAADAKLYDRIERLPDDPGRASLGMVRDSRDTSMLWVSGLGSEDMVRANDMSVINAAKRPSMRLMDVNIAISGLRTPRGEPMYEARQIERAEPSRDNPGLYPNLIHDGWGADTINVLSVDALLMMRAEYRSAIGSSRADSLMQAIDDASPTIWARTQPRR